MPPQIKRKPVPPSVAPNPFNASAEVPDQGKFVMIYGEPGEGKTTLAAQFPNPIFVITHGETGIDSAKNKGVADKSIPVVRLPELYKTDSIPDGSGHPAFEMLINTLHTMRDATHNRRSIVIDTLSGVEKMVEQHCASLEFKGDMQGRAQDEWNAWAAGPRRMNDGYWAAEFIPACLGCIEAGYNVVLLAHSKLMQIKNPNGPDYQKYQPDLQDRIFNTTSKALQYLFFLGREPEFQTDNKTKKRTVSSANRFIGTCNETWYAAKNWDNINEPIFCGSSPQETYAALSERITFK